LNGMRIYMLDTNTATYILRGRSSAARLSMTESLVNGRVAISAVTQADILFGLENKPGASRLRVAVEAFLHGVEVLAWDTHAAVSYARLRTRLQRAGKTLAALDMLIAAHAQSAGAVLVTHDQAFSQASPMIDVVDWATDL
jgi:tRNA(fMet)-specific endonuclease VapC